SDEHQLGRLVSESACERKDPVSNPAADMVDAARSMAWDLGKQPNNYRSNYPTQKWLDAILRDLPSSDSDATLPHTEDEGDDGDLPPHRTNSFPIHGSERLLDSGKATPTASDALIGQPLSGSADSPVVAPESSPVIGCSEVTEPGNIVSTSSFANIKFAPLPTELHRTMRFKKEAIPLGLDLDISGGWAIVTGVVEGGALDHLNRELPPPGGPRGVGGLDGIASAVLGPEKPNVIMTSTGSRIEVSSRGNSTV
ncbi:hypothetical protein FHG87_024265, partial [Trinorchestia longiramus]